MTKYDNSQPAECVYTPNPIKIDGSLSDPAWKLARDVPFYVPVTLEEPLSKTEAKVLWDDDYLYVGYRAYDKDIWSYFTERNSATCQEDVLEVFIQTDPEKEPYFNFEINALGTIYDAFNLKRGAGGEDEHRWKYWDCIGVKTGVFIKGKINAPEVIDEYWQLEVAIPFAELPTLNGKSPEPGDTWRFNLARYDYSIHLPKGCELSASSKLSEVNFHLIEEYRPLVFVK